jgi:2-polyprenyl-3-methyl-5-hydroxy-6-metoxy-1,4-benzoquinol methylase
MATLLKIGAPRHTAHAGITQGGYDEAHAGNEAHIRRLARPPARVLDVGAWEGAFSRRMKDLGFDTEACDRDPSSFRPADVTCHAVDLNDPSSRAAFAERRARYYDLVAALEIIEHVEDPWAFLRLLRAVTRPGGHVLLTTPNPGNFYSRLSFLRSGVMHQFAPSDESYGHINPLSTKELDMLFRSLRFDVIVKEPVQELPFVWLQRSAGATLKWAIAGALSIAMRGDKQGWCMRYVARVPD